MRAFHYEAIVTGTPSWEHLIGPIRSMEVKPVYNSFEHGMRRTADLAVMPLMISYLSRATQIYYTNALIAVHKGIPMSLIDWIHAPMDQTIQGHIIAQAEVMSEGHPDSVTAMRIALGLPLIERGLAGKGNPGMISSIESIFSAVILESWTAFECMVGELWEVGVDHGPVEIVRGLVVKGLKKEEDKDDEELVAQKMRELENDPRVSFGGFLREVGKVSFQTISKITQAYKKTFGGDISKVFSATSKGYIFALAAVRNVIIHKSGIIDPQFVKSVEEFPELNAYESGQRLQLDGKIVSTLRDAAVFVGLELIKKIDNLVAESKREPEYSI